MAQRIKVEIEKDSEGEFFVLPEDVTANIKNPIWVIDQGKSIELHLNGDNYRKRIWTEALTKLNAEIGELSLEEWLEFCALAKPKS